MRIGLGLGLTGGQRRAAAWMPTDVGGCLLYLLAGTAQLYQDDAGTVPVTATSDPVGRWADLSASAYHLTQATAAQRGTYDGDGLGSGKPAVTFDGTDDGLTRVATLTASAITVGLVWKLRAASGSGVIQTPIHVALDGSRALLVHIGSNGGYTDLTVACNTAGSNGVGVASLCNDTAVHYAVITYDGTGPTDPSKWTISVDGTPRTVATSGFCNVIAGTTSLGKYPTAFYAQANVRASILYNSVLGTTDKAALTTYLAGLV